MAKDFNKIYLETKEKVYSQATNALIVLAKANSAVDFSVILAPNGKLDATTSSFNVQRRKRPTVNAVANANTGSTAAALAALDQFSKADWESLPVATGILRSVGFKQTFADDYDFSNNPQHAKDMTYIVGEIATTRKKGLNELLLTAPKTGAALPAYAEGKTDVWNAIAAENVKVAQVDDSFKDVAGLSDLVNVISPTVALELAQEMGKVFNQEAAIAMTGFTSGMQINGTPVIVEPRFTGREVISMNKEALGFKSVEISKAIAVDLGLTEYTGKFFFDVMTIVDTARIKQFGAAVK